MHRRISLLFVLLAIFFLSGCNPGDTQDLAGGSELEDVVMLENVVVEASCGQCNFEMSGSGCELAIRHGSETYFVDGVGIDDLGDAHAEDGFCNVIREARVSGYFAEDRFVAKEFELLSDDEEQPPRSANP